MKVKVELYALLAKYLPANSENKTALMEFPEGASVQEVLKELKIPGAMPKILLVNGRHAELDRVLVEGDTLSIFPPIAGGSRARGWAKYLTVGVGLPDGEEREWVTIFRN